MKFDICIKNIKNLQSNGLIFKMYSHVTFLVFSETCSILHSQTLSSMLI